MTAMPGIALVLAVLALAATRRWAWVGVVLGLLVFLKLILVPVAVVGAAVFCESRKVRSCSRVLGGLAASGAVGVLVLALRGELTSYGSMVSRNSAYADRMVVDGALAGFVDHLSKALPAGGYAGERIAVGAIAVCLALVAWRTPSGSRRLVLCAGVVAVSCTAVLGLTAVWPHHAQLLALPACLTLVAGAASGPPRGTSRYVTLVAVGLLAAYLMGGATPVTSVLIKPSTAAQPLQQVRGDSPEARSIAGTDDLTDYSRLGRNDRDAHARGLGALELACPDFQQYPFDPPSTFARTLRCLPHSDVVFIADNFADQAEPAGYVRFTSEAEAIVARHFRCTVTDHGRTCLRATHPLRRLLVGLARP